MSKTIRQTATFGASPHAVYEALMDQKKHSKFTGSQAKVSRKVGGEFSIWDGSISGKNLELIPDSKIVQLWRSSDWDEGVYSKATFALQEAPNGTRLTFTQTGVPDEYYEEVKQGWKDYYWNPMKEMLEK